MCSAHGWSSKSFHVALVPYFLAVAAIVGYILTEYFEKPANNWLRGASKVVATQKSRKQPGKGKADAPKIVFTCIDPAGKSMQVSSLSALHTVAELKETVAAATGGDVTVLRIIFKNAPLDDNSTLQSCGVSERSEVSAVAKSAEHEDLLPSAAP